MRGDLSAEASRPLAERRAARRALEAALLASLLLAGRLSAQSRITAAVDTARATVGDRITMTVAVEHPEEARVEWPDSFDLAPFEVLGAEVRGSTAVLTLTAFELGDLEIPGFEVEVVGPDGAREVLATDPWGVEVASVGVDESGEIRDIRGPLSIPMSVVRVLLLALGPLVLIALLYTLARRLRSRDTQPKASLAALERPAHEIALEALATLEASDLLARGEVKEYHIEVSDILRAYVERRFRVYALEMSTREVLEGLQRVGADESFREGVGAFLDQCDMVKFAKVRPGADVCRQVLQLGRRLVQGSVPPRPEPSAGGDAADGALGQDDPARSSGETATVPAAGASG